MLPIVIAHLVVPLVRLGLRGSNEGDVVVPDDGRFRSWKRHRGRIHAHLGFRAWSEQIEAVALVEGLVGGAAFEGLGFDKLVGLVPGGDRFLFRRNCLVPVPGSAVELVDLVEDLIVDDLMRSAQMRQQVPQGGDGVVVAALSFGSVSDGRKARNHLPRLTYPG